MGPGYVVPSRGYLEPQMVHAESDFESAVRTCADGAEVLQFVKSRDLDERLFTP
jgi:hypothetical protein